MWEAAEITVLLQLVYLILSESEVCGAVKNFFYQVKEKKNCWDSCRRNCISEVYHWNFMLLLHTIYTIQDGIKAGWLYGHCRLFFQRRNRSWPWSHGREKDTCCSCWAFPGQEGNKMTDTDAQHYPIWPVWFLLQNKHWWPGIGNRIHQPKKLGRPRERKEAALPRFSAKVKFCSVIYLYLMWTSTVISTKSID